MSFIEFRLFADQLMDFVVSRCVWDDVGVGLALQQMPFDIQPNFGIHDRIAWNPPKGVSSYHQFPRIDIMPLA